MSCVPTKPPYYELKERKITAFWEKFRISKIAANESWTYRIYGSFEKCPKQLSLRCHFWQNSNSNWIGTRFSKLSFFRIAIAYFLKNTIKTGYYYFNLNTTKKNFKEVSTETCEKNEQKEQIKTIKNTIRHFGIRPRISQSSLRPFFLFF